MHDCGIGVLIAHSKKVLTMPTLSLSLSLSIIFLFHSFTDTRIVLITGNEYEDDGGDEDGRMELIVNDNMTTLCQINNDFPIDGVRGATGNVLGTSMIICGGDGNLKDCYEYTYEKNWTHLTQMTTARWGAASVIYNGAIWVSGGANDEGNELSNTELIFPNGTANQGIDLPEEINGHCAVEWNGTIIITGAGSTWIYSSNEDLKLTIGPRMEKARYWHGCGIFKSPAHSGRPLVLTAGGVGGGGASRISEFWDFTVPGTKWQLSKLCSFICTAFFPLL